MGDTGPHSSKTECPPTDIRNRSLCLGILYNPEQNNSEPVLPDKPESNRWAGAPLLKLAAGGAYP